MNGNNMKRVICIIAALGVLFSCHQPETIEPTTDSIGLSSVSATFIDGDLSSDPTAIFTAQVTNLDEDIVIKVPWFYPEDSDKTITDISKMKITASMDYNCFLSPTLTLLDLNKENMFEFTDGRGEKHKICIRGEIAKLSKKSLVSFAVTEPSLVSILDDENKTVTITISDGIDISACKVEYTISPHATCSLDGLTSVNFNNVKSIDVTAHDGTTASYQVILSDVSLRKIPYGFRSGSESKLWSADLVGMGIGYTSDVNPSLAVLGSNLVVCPGNGDTPFYLNKSNGVKAGDIVLGSAEASGVIKNDDAGHMLIANRTTTDFHIWMTSSVTEAPVELISYTITSGFPLGGKMSVQGDVTGNALIVMPFEAIPNISSENEIIIWEITDGVVAEPRVIALTGFVGLAWNPGYWGSSPDGIPAVAPLTSSLSDGMLFGVYDEDVIYHIDGTTFAMTQKLGSQGDDAWMYNNNSIAVKDFNNARYATLLCSGFFPQWGGVPVLYVYDIANLSTVTGNVNDSPATVLVPECGTFYVNGEGPTGAGDVIIVPSADGYYLNMYYVEHNNRIIEAFQCDCIDK